MLTFREVIGALALSLLGGITFISLGGIHFHFHNENAHAPIANYGPAANYAGNYVSAPVPVINPENQITRVEGGWITETGRLR